MNKVLVVTEDTGKIFVFKDEKTFRLWKQSILADFEDELIEEDSITANDLFEEAYTIDGAIFYEKWE